MSGFSERLKSEIEYTGLNQKEFAAKAGIKKRALDMYLGTQSSMPPADTAVKMASALGLSVEYLVTGKENRKIKPRDEIEISRYIRIRDVIDDLLVLPDEILVPVKTMVKSFAKQKLSDHFDKIRSISGKSAGGNE